jgi:hypothetical protein
MHGILFASAMAIRNNITKVISSVFALFAQKGTTSSFHEDVKERKKSI